jgi:hypothetical protein
MRSFSQALSAFSLGFFQKYKKKNEFWRAYAASKTHFEGLDRHDLLFFMGGNLVGFFTVFVGKFLNMFF